MANVLQKIRIVASGTLSAPVAVGAGAVAQVTTTIVGLLKALPAADAVARVSILSSAMTTDAGGQAFIAIQNANLQSGGGAVSGPAFTGSPLGLAHGSVFQGEMRFHSEDVPAADDNASLVVLVKNSDASSHNVTALNLTLVLEAVIFDAPVYAEGLGL